MSKSKNLKGTLVRKLIKSKLYLLILLSISTGGTLIGSIMVPQQTPPAQALWTSAAKVVATSVQDMPKVFSMYTDDILKVFCKGGPTYDSTAKAAGHTLKIINKSSGQSITKNVPYGDLEGVELPKLIKGRYIWEITSESMAGESTKRGKFNVIGR